MTVYYLHKSAHPTTQSGTGPGISTALNPVWGLLLVCRTRSITPDNCLSASARQTDRVNSGTAVRFKDTDPQRNPFRTPCARVFGTAASEVGCDLAQLIGGAVRSGAEAKRAARRLR